MVARCCGWLLREATLSRTIAYQESEDGLPSGFLAAWGVADPLQDVMLKVENPTTASAYKTNLFVEARDLDPQNPPTSEFVDWRVSQKSNLTSNHFLSEKEDTVEGEKARQIMYAYAVQPIDQPRRISLPVVVVARDASSSATIACITSPLRAGGRICCGQRAAGRHMETVDIP